MDETSVDEEQEQPAATSPVPDSPIQQPARRNNTRHQRRNPVKKEADEEKTITEADYKISTTIGTLGADLISISGRIGSGPKCYDMSVIATATKIVV